MTPEQAKSKVISNLIHASNQSFILQLHVDSDPWLFTVRKGSVKFFHRIYYLVACANVHSTVQRWSITVLHIVLVCFSSLSCSLALAKNFLFIWRHNTDKTSMTDRDSSEMLLKKHHDATADVQQPHPDHKMDKFEKQGKYIEMHRDLLPSWKAICWEDLICASSHWVGLEVVMKLQAPVHNTLVVGPLEVACFACHGVSTPSWPLFVHSFGKSSLVRDRRSPNSFHCSQGLRIPSGWYRRKVFYDIYWLHYDIVLQICILSPAPSAGAKCSSTYSLSYFRSPANSLLHSASFQRWYTCMLVLVEKRYIEPAIEVTVQLYFINSGKVTDHCQLEW